MSIFSFLQVPDSEPCCVIILQLFFSFIVVSSNFFLTGFSVHLLVSGVNLTYVDYDDEIGRLLTK